MESLHMKKRETIAQLIARTVIEYEQRKAGKALQIQEKSNNQVA
jgi:hypothetical protein